GRAEDEDKDGARGAEEGEGHRIEGPPAEAREGDRQSRGGGERTRAALAGGEREARRLAEDQGAARHRPHRARAGAAPRRPRQSRGTRLWRDPRPRSEAEEDRGGGGIENRRDGARGGDAGPDRPGGVALDRHPGGQDAGRRAREAAADGDADREARGRPDRGGRGRV